MDLIVIEELSDELTCFELVFAVHTWKVLCQVNS